MLSKPSGSSATVLTPSPKSPVTNRGRKLLIASNIHALGFGVFREHIFIVDAESIQQIKEVVFK